MDDAARVRGLEAEIDRLQARVDQLEGVMGMAWIAPMEWGLTGAQTRVFGVLMARELATKDAIMAGVYRDVMAEEAQPKIVDVFICHIRRKLKPFGLTIETVWGRGYRLSAEAKAAVNARLEAGMAA